MGIVERYLSKLNMKKQRFARHVVFLVTLSLLVVLTVSWNLRQTGIAIANDASCGMEEHRHTEECATEKVLICGFQAEVDSPEVVEAPTDESLQESAQAPTDAPAEVLAEEPAETLAEELPRCPQRNLPWCPQRNLPRCPLRCPRRNPQSIFIATNAMK